MSWKTLLASRTVQQHKTSKKEIESLRQFVAPDLTDAAIEGFIKLLVGLLTVLTQHRQAKDHLSHPAESLKPEHPM